MRRLTSLSSVKKRSKPGRWEETDERHTEDSSGRPRQVLSPDKRLEKISEEERGKCDVSMYISYAFPSVRNKCATDNDGWLNDG
jgi:hypothetical protein